MHISAMQCNIPKLAQIGKLDTNTGIYSNLDRPTLVDAPDSINLESLLESNGIQFNGLQLTQMANFTGCNLNLGANFNKNLFLDFLNNERLIIFACSI